MSSVPMVFEGTWDDLLKRSSEFAGHRLRITVLDNVPHEHPAFDKSPEGIAAWLRNFEEHVKTSPPIRIADDALDAVYKEQLDHQL